MSRVVTLVTALARVASAVRVDEEAAAEEFHQAEIKEWLASINVYRCIHGAPPVIWNDDIADGAQDWADSMPPLKHSHSYEMKPPQGESLSSSPAEKSIHSVAATWYNQSLNCVKYPGCEKSKTPGKHVGDFTAMVWKSVKQIGCGTNQARSDKQWYYVCRFSAGDKLDYDTPNMHGGYKANVLAPTGSYDDCVAKYDPSKAPDGGSAAGSSEKVDEDYEYEYQYEYHDYWGEEKKDGKDCATDEHGNSQPAEAVPAGPGATDAAEWLTATNKYRCMHGSAPVTWSEDLAKQAAQWAEQLPPMRHAATYQMQPPQGENLAMSMPNKDITQRVKAWYSQVDDCAKFPGCEKSKTRGKHTGAFTALVWKGVKEIGCAAHHGHDGAWYYVCRYASGPKLSYDTPNMGGGYVNNVLAKVREEQQCAAASTGTSESSAGGYETMAESQAPEPVMEMPKLSDKATWLASTNKLRCLHGAAPVTWNAEVAKAAQEWAEAMPPMKHSNSYELNPPCGENLAMATRSEKDIPAQVNSWYSEVEHCKTFPGCEKSKTKGKHVGHFTALVWKGVKEIGCGSAKGPNGYWYYVCRYVSGPKLSFESANMGGGYTKNVFPADPSLEAECQAQYGL